MRVTFVLFVAVVVSVVSCTPHGFVKPLVGYHEAVGIPAAARIKAAEELVSRSAQDFDDRIVGGAIAPSNSYPYLAGLIINFVNIGGQSVCGSSLVTTSRLLTAAHCWYDGANQASVFTVVLGSQYLFTGGTRISTSRVVTHPQWNPAALSNDVAVIYLPTSIYPSSLIQPISLPTGSDSFVGMWAIAAGYGKTNDASGGITTSTQVSHVNLQVISVAQCQATFGSYVLQSNICTNGAGGVGICGGDSGGPLVITQNGRRVLVGISSFVASTGCQLGYPSAFARVSSFSSFIYQHL